ncbi:MAG: NnrU family protein, partial [Gammaproteobacteria bacterium]
MTFLVIGVVLWSVAHLLPAIAQGPRQQWIRNFGEPRYKLVFTLVIASSLALIIGGWKSAGHLSLYPVGLPMRWLALALMLGSIILFVASATRNNFKRWLRHPQMLSVILWRVAH